MITLLQKYVRINTAYPNPDYAAAVALFKDYAAADGLLANEIILPSGNPVLVITLPGSSPELPALALNHHMDVVPADNVSEWLHPPFAGIVHESVIYGRGTQDCKGVGVAQYEALRQLKHSGVQPQRTVHFIMVPDEERGGFHGTKEFIEHPIFASLNIGYVLDEGMASGDDNQLLIKVDERTPLQIRLTSTGPQGHASGLFHQNCAHMLINVLASIVAFHTQQQKLLDEPGKCVSMHITSLSTNNSALNVISSRAQATVDVRIPSPMSLEDGIALIDAVVKEQTHVTYEILATSQERFKPIASDSIFYQTLAQAISTHGLSVKPFTFEATTDARFYSHRGIQALGFTPFSVTPNLHGTNESIRVKDLLQGAEILSTFLRAFCTAHN